MNGPIHPNDIANIQAETIPDVVWKVFNKLIEENYDGVKSEFSQNLALALIINGGINLPITDAQINVEEGYRANGWIVQTWYDAGLMYRFTRKYD